MNTVVNGQEYLVVEGASERMKHEDWWGDIPVGSLDGETVEVEYVGSSGEVLCKIVSVDMGGFGSVSFPDSDCLTEINA